MASPPAVGSVAPDFTLPSTAGRDVTLSALRGKNVLLAFFPLAFTSVCTREMREFSEDYARYGNAATAKKLRGRDRVGLLIAAAVMTGGLVWYLWLPGFMNR